jgi:hypothetical protein
VLEPDEFVAEAFGGRDRHPFASWHRGALRESEPRRANVAIVEHPGDPV